MNYIYHMVPKDMEGDTLYPLNTLKDTNPDLYIKKAAKYEGRMHVMENYIPSLKCMWNDVLHFSPVAPADIKRALIEAGMSERKMRFFQIDPNLLDLKLATLYLNNQETMGHNMTLENFTQLKIEELNKYTEIPQETKDYYFKKFNKGETPLAFVKIPHVLYKGSINVSNSPIIEV
ncbi:MAG: hypothetical protein KBC06_01615 [Candidatus Pacebacteria bacterium]|nr:hypothetical protein [Candidatus Paceibacterota bacterium]